MVIGILGGGQLAKMFAQAAQRMSFRVKVLDPTPECPASAVAEQMIGSFKDPETIFKFAQGCHVLTLDIEHVEVEILYELEGKIKIIPSPRIISLIQNKLMQREFLAKANLPTPSFKKLKDPSQLPLLLPVVQKAIHGGYDGRGTVILKSKEDLFKALTVPSFVEEYLELAKELSVIVVRNEEGQTVVYEVSEMVFHEEGNLLDYLICPARIEKSLEKEAKELALEVVRALQGVGIFAIELFLDRNGKLYVNEIAPRPHNSGHHTIEACYTSQFEQYVRVVTGLPLGSAALRCPAVMFNLLGEEGYFGKPLYEGLPEALSLPGVYVHIYGKKETFPFRKMGHVVVLGQSIEEALDKAFKIKKVLKVKGELKK